jgi:DNA primase
VRLGRDPLSQLAALGQLRTNPHLGPDADPTAAARAIEAEMVRHAAWMDMESEVRDAVAAIAGAADEGLTWRLRQAGDAHHRADREALAEDEAGESDASSDLSRRLQGYLDRQIWKKPRKR